MHIRSACRYFDYDSTSVSDLNLVRYCVRIFIATILITIANIYNCTAMLYSRFQVQSTGDEPTAAAAWTIPAA